MIRQGFNEKDYANLPIEMGAEGGDDVGDTRATNKWLKYGQVELELIRTSPEV